MFEELPILGERVSNYVRLEDRGGGGFAINLPVVWETGETTVSVSPKEALYKYYEENPDVIIIESIELGYHYTMGSNGEVPLSYKIVGGFGTMGHYHPKNSHIPATG